MSGVRSDTRPMQRGPETQAADPPYASVMLADGPSTPALDDYRRRASTTIKTGVVPLVEEAESTGRFPCEAITVLAREGLLQERWTVRDGLLYGVVLAEELGHAGTGGVGTGIGVHAEATTSILHRFQRGALLSQACEDALAGRRILCLAASEEANGSDLMGVSCSAQRRGSGWRVRGRKRYVSLGACADMALVLCAASDGSGPLGLSVLAVPGEAIVPIRRWSPVGARSLETVEVEIDAEVPDGALVGRPGGGMLVTSWGLSHERLMGSALALGGMAFGLDLALTHLHERHQFGAALIEHQALRLRLADLVSQVRLARFGVYGFAASTPVLETRHARVVAGIKVTVARLAERVASECMHFFGGMGYVEDEMPLARLWRDARFGRVGGGTDEVMWELVAGGLPPPHGPLADGGIAQ